MSSLNEIQDTIKSEAEKNLIETFPQKIVKLQKILSSNDFDVQKILFNVASKKNNRSKSTEKCGDDPDILKVKMCDLSPNVDNQADFSLNNKITALAEKTKPLIYQCIDDMQILQLWIHLNIPKIEDGNNFGVSIQEKIIEKLKEIENELLVRLEFFSDYHYYRAKLLAKYYRYPRISDFKMSVIEYDQSIIVQTIEIIEDLRNYYALSHDMFVKNLTKLKKPRNDNGASYAIS